MFKPNERVRSLIFSTVKALVFAVFVMSAMVVSAQLPTGTFLGVVKDSSGAVVPDVTITIRNVDTGLSRTATTNSDGDYRVLALPVGNYAVNVEKAGFKPETRQGLKLEVSQEAVINFTLEVGTAAQAITVTGEAPIVNTTSGSLGGLVDEQRVADLPLNGRNYINLTLLQTGITLQGSKSSAETGIG